MFELMLTPEAELQFNKLESNKSQKKRFKAVSKALYLLAANPRHPSLQTHKYESLKGLNNEEIFEAYAEQNAPAAYRIFWHYGPQKRQITIISITAHP